MNKNISYDKHYSSTNMIDNQNLECKHHWATPYLLKVIFNVCSKSGLSVKPVRVNISRSKYRTVFSRQIGSIPVR